MQEKVEKGVFFALAVPCLLIPLFMGVGKPLVSIIYQSELAGEMLPRIAFLLLPMSLNAILVSMLNSLGFEKQTFLIFVNNYLFHNNRFYTFISN